MEELIEIKYKRPILKQEADEKTIIIHHILKKMKEKNQIDITYAKELTDRAHSLLSDQLFTRSVRSEAINRILSIIDQALAPIV